MKRAAPGLIPDPEVDREIKRVALDTGTPYEQLAMVWAKAHAGVIAGDTFALLPPNIQFMAVKDLNRQSIQAMCNTSVSFLKFCKGGPGRPSIWDRILWYRYGKPIGGFNVDSLTRLRAHAIIAYDGKPGLKINANINALGGIVNINMEKVGTSITIWGASGKYNNPAQVEASRQLWEVANESDGLLSFYSDRYNTRVEMNWARGDDKGKADAVDFVANALSAAESAADRVISAWREKIGLPELRASQLRFRFTLWSKSGTFDDKINFLRSVADRIGEPVDSLQDIHPSLGIEKAMEGRLCDASAEFGTKRATGQPTSGRRFVKDSMNHRFACSRCEASIGSEDPGALRRHIESDLCLK